MARVAGFTEDLERYLKNAPLRDLRVQARLRGLSPAGGKEYLVQGIKDNMVETGDFTIKSEDGTSVLYGAPTAGVSTDDQVAGHARNNYSRPDGQNVGNFLTDRSSSRVLAPPGGGSSIVFGDYEQPSHHNHNAAHQNQNAAPAPGSLAAGDVYANGNPNRNANNYARPQGQNVGNFMTDRSAVKIHNPPGGTSQITFG